MTVPARAPSRSDALPKVQIERVQNHPSDRPKRTGRPRRFNNIRPRSLPGTRACTEPPQSFTEPVGAFLHQDLSGPSGTLSQLPEEPSPTNYRNRLTRKLSGWAVYCAGTSAALLAGDPNQPYRQYLLSPSMQLPIPMPCPHLARFQARTQSNLQCQHLPRHTTTNPKPHPNPPMQLQAHSQAGSLPACSEGACRPWSAGNERLGMMFVRSAPLGAQRNAFLTFDTLHALRAAPLNCFGGCGAWA